MSSALCLIICVTYLRVYEDIGKTFWVTATTYVGVRLGGGGVSANPRSIFPEGGSWALGACIQRKCCCACMCFALWLLILSVHRIRMASVTHCNWWH